MKNIPTTTLTVFPICLGSTDFGATLSVADTFRLLDAYVERGGNFIDTARVYADWIPNIPRSISERTIGQWLKERGNRARIVLATKGGHPELATMQISRLSKAEIEHDLNASLKLLQTDVIDLYWLHRDDPRLPIEGIMDTLNAQIKAGKIRYLGASNWSVARLQAAQAYAQKSGQQGFVANQPLWSLAERNPLDPTLGMVVFGEAERQFHQQTGMAVIPYTSQAGGFFSKLAHGGLETLKPGVRASWLNPTSLRRFEVARQLAQARGVPIGHIVLGYLLSQPFVTIPIVGCKTLAHLAESLDAVNTTLTTADLASLLDADFR